jgi:hypothetical protein
MKFIIYSTFYWDGKNLLEGALESPCDGAYQETSGGAWFIDLETAADIVNLQKKIQLENNESMYSYDFRIKHNSSYYDYDKSEEITIPYPIIQICDSYTE